MPDNLEAGSLKSGLSAQLLDVRSPNTTVSTQARPDATGMSITSISADIKMELACQVDLNSASTIHAWMQSCSQEKGHGHAWYDLALCYPYSHSVLHFIPVTKDKPLQKKGSKCSVGQYFGVGAGYKYTIGRIPEIAASQLNPSFCWKR